MTTEIPCSNCNGQPKWVRTDLIGSPIDTCTVCNGTGVETENTVTTHQCEFLNDLEDTEYRNLFASELVGASLAFQIRRLRDARGFTQDELAQLVGKKQTTISLWENPDYGKYNLSTLKTLAGAFDVGLLVRFVSFSELADWTIDVSPDRLTPPSYEQECHEEESKNDVS